MYINWDAFAFVINFQLQLLPILSPVLNVKTMLCSEAGKCSASGKGQKIPGPDADGALGQWLGATHPHLLYYKEKTHHCSVNHCMQILVVCISLHF